MERSGEICSPKAILIHLLCTVVDCIRKNNFPISIQQKNLIESATRLTYTNKLRNVSV